PANVTHAPHCAFAALLAAALACNPLASQRPGVAPAGSDTDAAKLELLALRTAISRQTPVRSDSFIIAASPAPISADSAIRSLSRLPKPLVCEGLAQRDMLNITCTALANVEPRTIAADLTMRYMPTYGSITGGGGLLGYARRQRGVAVDSLLAVCIGRDTLVLPAPALERWERDYYEAVGPGIPAYNMGGGNLDEDGRPLAAPGQPEERRREVVTYRFASSADQHGISVGITIGGTTARPSEDDALAAQADQLDGLTFGADEPMLRPALAKIAASFTQHWAGRTAPPMIAMFVARYKGRPDTDR
ncbi:MAG TPA: hypothetical protein VNW46_06940, partial [Gemmatimonadaceae bacterium]|nr:hypothetical protein [Gemmatimonadaceae bacterium]